MPLVTRNDLARVFSLQRERRWALKMSSATQRIERLTRLRTAVESHAHEFNAALSEDLRRPPESPVSMEAAVVVRDIDDTIEHLPDWMAQIPSAPEPMLPDTIPQQPALEQFIQYEARGVTLIFGAWNQPFMLTLQPLVAAIAAGNAALVKPNELSPACSGTAGHDHP